VSLKPKPNKQYAIGVALVDPEKNAADILLNLFSFSLLPPSLKYKSILLLMPTDCRLTFLDRRGC
jgi:hypothetical protein